MTPPILPSRAFAFAAAFTVSLSAPAFSDSVKFKTEIPNLGTVTLDVQTVQPNGHSGLHTHATAYTMNLMQGQDGIGSWPYASRVRYYGEDLTYEQVMGRKLAYADSFPYRDYRIDPSSFDVWCADVCDVSVEIDFVASNPATHAHAQGRFSMFLTLAPSGDSFVILAEDGMTLSYY